jgi:molybdopterin/thiamine biosynthesis adenylyltransferase
MTDTPRKMPINGPDYWRQLGILPPSNMQGITFTIIAAGGIGSPTALTICKMGAKDLTIWDDDVVDRHNLPNQLFRYEDLGKMKVIALKEILAGFAPTNVVAVTERYTKNSPPLAGIVISGVDSMAARKEIWEKICGNQNVPIYIEARMGALALRIHSVNPNNPEEASWYETTLYSDDVVKEAPCTERAIFFTVMVAAGLIGDQVKKHIRKEPLEKEVIFDLQNLILV